MILRLSLSEPRITITNMISLHIAVLAAALAFPAPAPAVDVDTITKHHFEIPALPLTDALQEFARRTGLDLRVEVPLGQTLRAQAVSGL